MQQAQAFYDEVVDLGALLQRAGGDVLEAPTQFKDWTVYDIVLHLHHLDTVMFSALREPEAFSAASAPMMAALGSGRTMIEAQRSAMGALPGDVLVERWLTTARELGEAFAAADPKRRVPWFGPSMSARTAVSSRQMETWSHAQAVWDLLDIERVHYDRLRNVAHLCVRTIAFAFTLRGRTPPEPAPSVHLLAPSGAEWVWNAPNTEHSISGSAVSFCQVATQTRSIADVSLTLTGEKMVEWGTIAQAFAGLPENPPAPGTRGRGTCMIS